MYTAFEVAMFAAFKLKLYYLSKVVIFGTILYEVLGILCRIFIAYSIANHLSLVMRKPAFCICENKDADQLRGNREADQRLCFRYTDSTITLLPKSEISSL